MAGIVRSYRFSILNGSALLNTHREQPRWCVAYTLRDLERDAVGILLRPDSFVVESVSFVSRKYPLDLPPEPAQEQDPAARRSWLRPDGLAIGAARLTASALLSFLDWRRAHRDLSQSLSVLMLLVFGIGLTGSAGLIDEYLHRGVETGVEQPYVVQPAGKELAANVNLMPYTGEGLIDIAEALSSSGFRYVRQDFSWATMEPAQGEYDWTRYDEVVAQMRRRNIQIIAVVKDAPQWAMIADPASPTQDIIVDPNAYSEFMHALTSHFLDSVGFVQLWDRPNLKSATPSGSMSAQTFVRLLAAGANGAREGWSEVKVLLPELALNSEEPAKGNDLDYLANIYNAGGHSFFDVVAIPLDGTVYSPDDRRVSETRQNLSRAILYRELMLDKGDSAKPVWATSFGWAATGDISRETQAEFVGRGLQRSWAEWPWMGLMVQWRFLADTGSPEAPYSIVNPDGTATPLYDRLVNESLRKESVVAHTGFTPMDSVAIKYQGNWQDQHLEGRTFKTTSQVGSSMTLTFNGTGAVAFMRSGPRVGEIRITLDGELIPGGAGEDGTLWDFSWWETRDLPRKLLGGLDESTHVMTITLAGDGELTLGGMVVARDAPFIWPIMLMSAAAFISFFLAMRSFIYLVAMRTGHLMRKDVMPNPALPAMPNWRPSRRV